MNNEFEFDEGKELIESDGKTSGIISNDRAEMYYELKQSVTVDEWHKLVEYAENEYDFDVSIVANYGKKLKQSEGLIQ